MILTFTGASGTGKTTLVKKILQQQSAAKLLLSTTTRTPRKGDAPGEYEFVSRERFMEMHEHKAFLWKTEIAGNFYGTRCRVVDEALDGMLSLTLATLDLSGVRKLQDHARERSLERFVVSSYILSPGDDKLRSRMLRRGDSPEEVERRLALCRSWDQEARSASDVKLNFTPDRDSLDGKLETILSYLGRLSAPP